MSDDESFDLTSVLTEAFDFIKAGFQGGGKVLVHCQMGQSRSAAIVTAFLMHSQKLTFEEAFGHVKERREIVSAERFGKQLKKLESALHDNTLGS
jgi:protein-tyrosine phosphatase